MYQNSFTGNGFHGMFDDSSVDPAIWEMLQQSESHYAPAGACLSTARTSPVQRFGQIEIDNETAKLLAKSPQFDRYISKDERMDCSFFDDILNPGECLDGSAESMASSVQSTPSVNYQPRIDESVYFYPAPPPPTPEFPFGSTNAVYCTPDSYLPPPSPSGDENVDMNEWYLTDEAGKRRRPLLHEFLRLLLANPRYADVAGYIQKGEGIFRFHNRDRAAELWGTVKGRNSSLKMTYEKLARGIRTYYPTKIISRTRGRYTFRFDSASGIGITWLPA